MNEKEQAYQLGLRKKYIVIRNVTVESAEMEWKEFRYCEVVCK